jgi:putative ABC transport system ATP-binding protein
VTAGSLAAETTPVVRLSGVSVHYPAGDGSLVRALDRVSLAWRPGELVGIFGASGCGKTTLLMVAGLLQQPTAGTVRFDGHSAVERPADENTRRDFRRRNIGFVFQKANLIPFLTAVENVALAMIIDGIPKAEANRRALDLLSLLDVEHRSANRPAQLSGGEQQRVAVARALANGPRLLLADEPTAALDSRRGRRTIELMRSISRKMGTAVAVVTHDVRYSDLFDRILHMEDGRISAEQNRRDKAVCNLGSVGKSGL